MRFEQALRGGAPRSLGRTHEVVDAVLAAQGRLPELIACLADPDDVVRMRAADAVEKVARRRPDWLRPHLDRLLADHGGSRQPSLRWHLAQILEEVPLTSAQHARAVRFLTRALEDCDDWLVLTCAMQSATTLAARDAALAEWLLPHLRGRLDDRRPAVAKRAARQLARLGQTADRTAGDRPGRGGR